MADRHNSKDSKDRRRWPWRWRLGSERLSRWANWATVLTGAIVLVGTLGAILPIDLGGGDEPAPPPSQAANLQDVDLLVRNDLQPTPPALELLLHNAGRGRSVVSGARIEVLRVDPLPLCFAQGELPLSGHYGAQLSTEAKPGEVVEVPLHQQLGTDEADRFEIVLGLTSEEESSSGELPGLYLFELDVSLEHDGAQPPLRLGRALVSLPALPPSGAYYWARDTASSLKQYLISGDAPVQEIWGPPMPCWRANTEVLRQGLAGPAARSPQMDALSSEIVTPTFAALEE
jgi:hypothetical protein